MRAIWLSFCCSFAFLTSAFADSGDTYRLVFKDADMVLPAAEKETFLGELRGIAVAVASHFPDTGVVAFQELTMSDMDPWQMIPIGAMPDVTGRTKKCTFSVFPGPAKKTFTVWQQQTGISIEKLKFLMAAHELSHCQIAYDLQRDYYNQTAVDDSLVLRAVFMDEQIRTMLRQTRTSETPLRIDSNSVYRPYRMHEVLADMLGVLVTRREVGMTAEEIRRYAGMRRRSGEHDPLHDTSPWLYKLAERIDNDPDYLVKVTPRTLQDVAYLRAVTDCPPWPTRTQAVTTVASN